MKNQYEIDLILKKLEEKGIEPESENSVQIGNIITEIHPEIQTADLIYLTDIITGELERDDPLYTDDNVFS